MKRVCDLKERAEQTKKVKENEEFVKRDVGAAFFVAIAERVANMVSKEDEYLININNLENSYHTLKKEKDDLCDKLEDSGIIFKCDECFKFELTSDGVMCDGCVDGSFCVDCDDEGVIFQCECGFCACVKCIKNSYSDACSHIEIICFSCDQPITKGVNSYECSKHEYCDHLLCEQCFSNAWIK